MITTCSGSSEHVLPLTSLTHFGPQGSRFLGYTLEKPFQLSAAASQVALSSP